jgi:hypothetical protein
MDSGLIDYHFRKRTSVTGHRPLRWERGWLKLDTSETGWGIMLIGVYSLLPLL